MRLGARPLVLALVLPALASANGGGSRTWEAETRGAVLPGEGGELGTTELVRDEDVECVSELLTIRLRTADARVTVEYVLLNHGGTKRIEYAFPFAIGEQETVEGGRTSRKVFGKPRGYGLAVDGSKVPSREQPGLPVPPEIPVPAIDDSGGLQVGLESAEAVRQGAPARQGVRVENRYRFTYFVSPVELPAGKPVKLAVTYSAPYLVYAKRGEGEVGSAESPPSFSYLLSTGGNWRGGKIGSLKVTVRAPPGELPRHGIEGLPFRRAGDVATFEGRDVVPTADMNLFIVQADFAPLAFTLGKGPGPSAPAPTRAAPWVSPPPGGEPPELVLRVKAPEPWEPHWAREHPITRYRVGLSTPPGAPQLLRVRVELGFEDGGRDAFHAQFAPATPAEVAASGGFRYVFFDAPSAPGTIRLTFLDAPTGPTAQRIRLDGLVVERDVTNYRAFVQLPR